jgi:hypothetical protein
LAFPERKEEVVAGPRYSRYFILRRIADICRKFSNRLFYLHAFLANNCSAMNTKKKGRAYEDVLGITLGCLILFVVFHWPWLLYTAIIIGGLSLLSKKAAQLISLIWFKVVSHIGSLVSAVLLALVFFLLLTPLACLYRLFNSGNLMGNNEDSMYKSRDHLYSGDDLRNIW